MRALIVEEGHARGPLTAARALGRAGWNVGIGSPRPDGLAASSRWTRRWHRVPPAAQDLDSFLETTADAVRSGGYEVVFGAGDAEVLALSGSRDRFNCTVPYGPHSSVLAALDKLRLMEAARRAGLAAPETMPAADGDALEPFGAPVLVKPRLHWVPGAKDAPSRMEAMISRDRLEAARRVAEIRAAGGEPLLQEVVVGHLMAYAAVTDDLGRPVARVQQEADRIWPPRAGMSVRARTVAIDEELASKVHVLLADLGWYGLAEVQFLVPSDGEPNLIDLNGRFYGSLALAVAAGANLPDVWARLATGREVLETAPAALGVRYQWLEGDLRRAWVEQRGGLIQDVASCLAYARSATHSILSRDDPRPGLRHAAHLTARAIANLSRVPGGRP